MSVILVEHFRRPQHDAARRYVKSLSILLQVYANLHAVGQAAAAIDNGAMHLTIAPHLYIGEYHRVFDICVRVRYHLRKQHRVTHRSEEHTSELQSRSQLVSRLLLEIKK